MESTADIRCCDAETDRRRWLKKTGRPRLYTPTLETASARSVRVRPRLGRISSTRRPPTVAAVDHADPVGVLATWAAETLIVPPGHPLAGEPMVLPDFAVAWLRAAWDAHESALSTARKNAKSAISAGHSDRRRGDRAEPVSGDRY